MVDALKDLRLGTKQPFAASRAAIAISGDACCSGSGSGGSRRRQQRMSALEDVALGSVTAGVNRATFIALNALLGLTALSLAALTAVCAAGAAPALAPHAGALFVLSLLLWAAIAFFVGATGLVDAEQQRRELAAGGAVGGTAAAVVAEGTAPAAATAAASGDEKKQR